MREIKFRAWSRLSETMLNNDDLLKGRDSDMACILVYLLKKDKGNLEFMQYTGLKDKNGVEIYEGDIIEFRNGYEHHNTREVVKFEDGEFTNCHNSSDPWSGITSYIYVIGNIYENPELLEAK